MGLGSRLQFKMRWSGKAAGEGATEHRPEGAVCRHRNSHCKGSEVGVFEEQRGPSVTTVQWARARVTGDEPSNGTWQSPGAAEVWDPPVWGPVSTVGTWASP